MVQLYSCRRPPGVNSDGVRVRRVVLDIIAPAVAHPHGALGPLLWLSVLEALHALELAVHLLERGGGVHVVSGPCSL